MTIVYYFLFEGWIGHESNFGKNHPFIAFPLKLVSFGISFVIGYLITVYLTFYAGWLS